jgi:hypothetical protein
MKKLLFFLLLIKCFVIRGMEPNPTDRADFPQKKIKLSGTARANSSSSLQNLWKGKTNPNELRKVRSYESGKLPTSSLSKEPSEEKPKPYSREFHAHGSPKEETSLRKCESNSDSEDEETRKVHQQSGKNVFQVEVQKSPKFDQKYPSLHVPTRFPDRHKSLDEKSE